MRPPSAASSRSLGSSAKRTRILAATSAHSAATLGRPGRRLLRRHLLDPIVDRRVDGGVEVGDRRQQRAVGRARRVGAIEVGEHGAGRPHEVGRQGADRHPLQCARLVPAGRDRVARHQRGRRVDGLDHQPAHGLRLDARPDLDVRRHAPDRRAVRPLGRSFTPAASSATTSAMRAARTSGRRLVPSM